MPVWFLTLRSPKGKKSVKRMVSKHRTAKAVRNAYYNSTHHFRTESMVVNVRKGR